MFLSPAKANPGSLLIGLFCTDRVSKLWSPYRHISRHFRVSHPSFLNRIFLTDLECKGFDDRYVVWVQYQMFQVLEVRECWKKWSMSVNRNTGLCFFSLFAGMVFKSWFVIWISCVSGGKDLGISWRLPVLQRTCAKNEWCFYEWRDTFVFNGMLHEYDVVET